MKRLRETLRDTCRHLIYVSCILGAAVSSSCTDSDVGMTVTSGEDNGMPVLLSVSVSRSTASGIMTKAPDEEDEEPIENGWFSLVYPTGQNTNAVAVCPFKEGSGQIAYGYADSDTDFFTIAPFKKSLRTSDLYGKGVSDFRFIMDNVIAYEGDDHITNEQQSGTGLITFSEALKTRFSARLEQHQKSQFPANRTESDASSDNDLVWGYAYTTDGSDRIPLDDQLTSLDFQLTHRMSRLSVVILDAVPENESAKHEDFINNAGDLDIWITNIVSTPTSFDRSTGTVNIPGAEEASAYYTSYYLWDYTDMGSITTNEDTDLSKKETDAANEGLAEGDTQRQSIKCYRSKNLILPPDEHVGQRTGEDRPVLCVYYNGTLYSGVLPSSMTVVTTDSDGHTLQTSRSLAFSAGMHLLLRVRLVITDENPTIRFEPVQLIDWYEYGTYTVKGQEAGISSQEDFVELIRLYNGLQDANEQDRYKNMLEIYRKYAGPFDHSKWNTKVPEWSDTQPWCIPIYCNLSTAELTAKFSKEVFDRYPFTIESNGWRIDRYCYEFDGHWYRLLYDEADDDPIKLTTEDKYATQHFTEETDKSKLPSVLQEENTSSTFPTEGLPDGITPPKTNPLLE